MKKNIIISCIALSALTASMTACGAQTAPTAPAVSAVETTAAETTAAETTAAQTTTAAKETETTTAGSTAGTTVTEKTEEPAAEGSASVKDEGLDEPNEYGFYLVSSTPESGISIAALNGTWKDDDGDYIYFHDGDLYSGSFVVTYADKTIDEGYVQLEYSLNPDDSKEFWYNLYKYDGEFFLGFGVSGDIPLDELYAGQSGDPHYTREESGSGSADDFLGVWACGSITASIDRDPAGEYITVDIHWSASASEGATWTYQCTYDESANVLRCKGLGSRVDYSYSEDGTLTDSSVFDGSDAVFEIKDGALTWSDDKEDMDEELELLR